MDECCKYFIFKASEKGINLILDKDSLKIFPKELYIDGNRMKQILINLISNAIKYTEKGFVKLSGLLDRQNKQIIFRVEDTGIGMT
jgi:signal transduction histidine kinase